MGKKLNTATVKTAWMQMNSHSALLQYSANNQIQVKTKIGFLNNQSAVDVFRNAKILKASANLRLPCRYTSMLVSCTPTSLETCQEKEVVWYHKNGIANILYLANVKNKHKIMYDSSNGNQFVVHKSDGSTRIFKQSSHGLYYLNIGKESVAIMNTPEDEKPKYTVNAYKHATVARELQRKIGRLCTRDFINIIEASLLQNFL